MLCELLSSLDRYASVVYKLHVFTFIFIQTKDDNICISCFSAKHAALRCKNKDLLAQKDNLSEGSNMSTCGLLFQ